MGFFSGVGRALGSAAQGFGLGQRQGEQEAYNRYKTDELLNAKLATVHGHAVKEDVPYPVKSLLDTHRAVYASGDPNAINNWEASGQGETARQVQHAYSLGGAPAALKALSVVSQPKGTDVSAQMAGFGQTADIPVGFGPRPAPVDASQYSFLHPSIDPNYKYKYSPKEVAQTEGIQANTAKTKELTPLEADHIRAETQNIHDQFGLQQREQNLKVAETDFKNKTDAALLRLGLGQKDAAYQFGIWKELIDSAAHISVRGGDPSKFLVPLLFNKEMGGAEAPNPAAITEYLQRQGLNPDEIGRVLGGANVRAGGGALGLAPPGGPAPANNIPGQPAAGFGGPGGGTPPVLPAVGGAANPALAGAQQFTTGQGFTVTSTTGGQHNTGSLHYQGRAIDVGVRNKTPQEQKDFMRQAAAAGYTVRDERSRPKGQRVWSGPHIHLEWGQQGPPAALPGMTSEQVAGILAPDAGLNASGVNTPASAPKAINPWASHPESLEAGIWDLYTGSNGHQQVPAEELQRRFAGTPDEGKVAAVIAAANQITQGNLMPGVPAPSRLGAQVPNAPDLSGLGYPVGGGVPAVTTSPAPEPNVGFGGTPTPAVDLPPTPAAPPAGQVTITERPKPKVSLKARGGVNLTPKEKAGPGRDVTISPPPPVRSPQSMGPPTKGPVRDIHTDFRELNPAAAGFKAGQDTRAAIQSGGVKQLLTPQPGSGMDILVRTLREHLGRTGQDEVQIHRADPRSIYDLPELKGNEQLIGWNEVFKPWAQRMGYTTVDQVLGASKWYFAQEDRLRRPPYSLTQAEAQQQLKGALEGFASAPGKALRLRVPKTGGPGNPRIGISQTPGPGTVEYRGTGR